MWRKLSILVAWISIWIAYCLFVHSSGARIHLDQVSRMQISLYAVLSMYFVAVVSITCVSGPKSPSRKIILQSTLLLIFGLVTGCFVHINGSTMNQSGQVFHQRIEMASKLGKLEENSYHLSIIPRILNTTPKTIRLWRKAFIEGVKSGFGFIPFPFSICREIKRREDSDTPHFSHTKSRLVDVIKSHIENATKSDGWETYSSSWGIGNMQDWDSIENWRFNGTKLLGREARSTSNISPSTFRCISKVLVVMLFLRLEELDMADITEPLPLKLPNRWGIPARIPSLKNIFTNQAPGRVRRKFKYTNSPWKYVPAAAENSTSKPFLTAMKDYILGPMGISGRFDINTQHAPYASRGFNGNLEDLLLIGSTLMNRGLSPKTKQRIISPHSVDRVLKMTTLFQRYEPDFIVRQMKIFESTDGPNGTKFPNPAVDGYCLGLWHVNGWRHDNEGKPIEGWLSIGSGEALLYFDRTGLVVGMLASEKRDFGFTNTFPKVVRDFRSAVDEA